MGFFTHVEDEGEFLGRARRMDHCVSMSKLYTDWLRERGVSHVTHVPMGFDYYRFRPKLVLGVIGRLDHARKGLALVDRLRRLDFVEIVSTEGRLVTDRLWEIYQKIDYVLIPSLIEGGPMSLLEGLGSGRPVIAPSGVGMIPEFDGSPQVLLYPVGDADALEELVVECHREKLKRGKSMQDRTWDDWARSHHELFWGLLEERGLAPPQPADGFRFGLMAEMNVPYDVDVDALEAAVDRVARILYFGGREAALRELTAARHEFACMEALMDSL